MTILISLGRRADGSPCVTVTMDGPGGTAVAHLSAVEAIGFARQLLAAAANIGTGKRYPEAGSA